MGGSWQFPNQPGGSLWQLAWKVICEGLGRSRNCQKKAEKVVAHERLNHYVINVSKVLGCIDARFSWVVEKCGSFPKFEFLKRFSGFVSGNAFVIKTYEQRYKTRPQEHCIVR